MSWGCDLTRDAERDLRKLPVAIQRRVARVLTQMESDPFQGDVKSLQGDDWTGMFRRRLGDYRLIFLADRKKHIVSVLRILRRSGKTYR